MEKMPLKIDEATLPIIKQIAEGMPGGFFVYHADGDEGFIYVNNAMLRIFGCETEAEFKELTKNSFHHMVHPEDIDAVEKSIAEQIENSVHDLDYVEYRIIRKDGAVRWIVDYGHFVHTETYGDVFFVFIDDATERFRIKQERDDAIHENKAKSAFLLNMSNDLKAPINSIVGFVDMARKNLDGDKKKISGYLDKITSSCDLLVDLINDVLKMTEIESGNMNIHEVPCSLNEQLAIIGDMFKSQIKDKYLNYYPTAKTKHDLICADALNLKRIISNILQNAVNYTDEGGFVSFDVVELEGEGLPPDTYNYKFVISDTGCGMSKEFMERMYNAFEREHNPTKTHVSGTGLGLTVTKRLVEAMHGTISAESEVGKGTTFTVVIPFKTTTEKPAHTKHGSDEQNRIRHSHRKIKRVLLVEDNQMTREMTLEILREAGFEAEAACNGEEALEIFSSKYEYYYDLILMDLQMPRMNGFECSKAIRGLKRNDVKKLPIFAITSRTEGDGKLRAYESGMDRLIAKPLDIEKLLEMVVNI